MLMEIIFVLTTLFGVASYYLVAVPVLQELVPLILSSQSVSGSSASTVHLIFDITIYMVPLIISVGVLVWFIVSASRKQSYFGRPR